MLLTSTFLFFALQGALTPHPGWPQEFLGQGFYSPANICDVNGDAIPEILVRSQDGGAGVIHLFHHDGTELPGWPLDYGGNGFDGVSVIDLNRDGADELIFASIDAGVFGGGKLEVIDGTGAALPGWPLDLPGSQSFLMPPLVAPKGIASAFTDNTNHEHRFCVLNPRGKPLRWVETSATPYNAALGDLDMDGIPEMVIAGGNKLFLIGPSGRLPGWPADLQAHSWYLALGDLNGNGQREVVAAAGAELHALSASGSELPGFPFTYPGTTFFKQPALADLTADGIPEIIITDEIGNLHAIQVTINGPRQLSGFPISTPGVSAGAVVGDLNGDSRPDIVTASFESGGAGAQLLAYDASGQFVAGTPIALSGLAGIPSLADVDGDGFTEVVVTTYGSAFDFRGRVYVFDSQAPHDPAADWPLYRQSPTRSSQL